MRIAINGNRHQEEHFQQIDKLVSHLLRRGDDVVMTEKFYNYMCENLGSHFGLGIDYVPLTKQPHSHLAISIGGDGAFLKTSRWIGDSDTPIAGINTGHLGYLAAFSFADMDAIEHILLSGNYAIESRSRLTVEITGAPTDYEPLTALNEMAITRADTPAMLQISTVINHTAALNYVGDGLIIATPTGSTAYNLSVGGPILDPQMAGWVLSPIAAHSLSMRPIVVGDNSEIEINVDTRGKHYRAVVDGYGLTLPLSATLKVRRCPHPLQLVVKPGHTFTDTLRDKLGLGA